jgi:hypothetical protein
MNNDNIRRTCPIDLIFGQQVAKYAKENYIDKLLSLNKRRRYNIALNKLKENYLVDTQELYLLSDLKSQIFEYISDNEEQFDNIEVYLDSVSKLFDKDLNSLKLDEDMKKVQYMLFYFAYGLGEKV